MSRDWKAEREASNRRVRDRQKEYVRELRRARGDRPGRGLVRRAGSLLAVVAVVAAIFVVPRLLSDAGDAAETAAGDVRARVERTIEERSADIVEQVEEQLDVELSVDTYEIRADDLDAENLRWALPLDSIDAQRAVRPHHSYPAWDYGTSVGTAVYAMTAATVATATADDGDRCGGTVRLASDQDRAEITYCHLSDVVVATGDRVEAGELLGYTGGKPGAPGAGRSSGPHLHLQIRHDGQLRCPQAQLIALGDGRELPIDQLPTDCFYTASGLAGVGEGDAEDVDEAWFVWD